MHTRGPPPNGKYANRGSFAALSSLHRSGSNRSASTNHRGSRCVTHWLITRFDPAGKTYPPTSSASCVFRKIRQAGGYNRKTSRSTFSVYTSLGISPAQGARSPSTASSSACSFASTSGCCASKYQLHDRCSAVVSCPASSSVITSSRSCLSVIELPSSSRAISRSVSKSFAPSVPTPSLASRSRPRAIRPYTTRSSSASA